MYFIYKTQRKERRKQGEGDEEKERERERSFRALNWGWKQNTCFWRYFKRRAKSIS
jgi:hypothetical protein